MSFQPVFQYSNDHIPMTRLDLPAPSVESFQGQDIIVVDHALLRALAETAFYQISHFLRPGHLQQLAAILDDTQASENDKYVAQDLLRNANIAAGGVLPMCQDTGTAIVMAKKGNRVWTNGDDEKALSDGIEKAYALHNLRYSQMAPLTMYKEVNTGNNLPAQIDLLANKGEEFEFLFIAKGGGSANKTFLYQQTRAVLNEKSMLDFLVEKMASIGTSACPPYHLAVVIGGTSAEMNLKTVKLTSARYFDKLPISGDSNGRAFRDLDMESKVLKLAGEIGIGAQFGGKYFCHDVRVIRLPRHGASCPIGIGVSCSADRQMLAKITRHGVFVEQLEMDPARYLPEIDEKHLKKESISIDLNAGMESVLRQLDACTVSTRVSLNGTLIVARDIAHAKIKEKLVAGEPLPDYMKKYPVYYAGPAKTPKGMTSGSFGPTTAGRMDSYVDLFQQNGGSMIMLAKGNRSKIVRDACQKYGGFYLATIGGSAARVAQESIRKIDVLDYPELGMEAVWRIEVENFPAFVVIDNKGNDFFSRYNIAVE